MSDGYRVRTVFTGVAGAPWLSTQFYESGGALTSGEADEARAAVAAFWNSIRVHINDLVTIRTEGVVDGLDEDSGELVESFVGSDVTVVGSAAGDPLPVATQGVLRLNTGVVINGRRVRGKIFVPGMVETQNTEGVPIASFLTALSTAGSFLFSASPPSIAVYHRPVRPSPTAPPTGGQFVTANSTTPLPYWGSVRSRRD
jgi:hypothetical protein